MERWRVRAFVAVLTLATVLTACSSGGQKPSATGPTAPTGTTGVSSSPTVTSSSAPLTASFRGVTPTSIKLGIVTIDYTCIKQFVNYNYGNQPAIDQVFIDDLNAHGGILGRRIDPVYESYCPIGNSQALTLCTSFTEDAKVFAVLGRFFDSTGDANLCVSRDHQTIQIGHELSQEWINDAPPGLMLSPEITAERRATVLLNLLKAQGTLTGKKVATLTDVDTENSVATVIKPALDRMGVAQGSAAVVTIVGSDTSTAQTQLESDIEKWQGEGVNAIILAGQFVPAKQFVEKIRAAMPNVLLLTDGESSALGGGQDETAAGVKPNPYDGMLTANGLTDGEVWQSSGLQRCVQTYESRSGQHVIGPDQLKPGPDGKIVQVWLAVSDFCDELALFTQIAEKAGPNLTNDTWTTAANNFGEIQLPETVYSSIHAGKYDADDGFRLAVFDSTVGSKGDFKPLTPIEDASK
jgi:ABC-type branched-subunit amino acid transport system substrate-binding protein